MNPYTELLKKKFPYGRCRLPKWRQLHLPIGNFIAISYYIKERYRPASNGD